MVWWPWWVYCAKQRNILTYFPTHCKIYRPAPALQDLPPFPTHCIIYRPFPRIARFTALSHALQDLPPFPTQCKIYRPFPHIARFTAHSHHSTHFLLSWSLHHSLYFPTRYTIQSTSLHIALHHSHPFPTPYTIHPIFSHSTPFTLPSYTVHHYTIFNPAPIHYTTQQIILLADPLL